MAIENELSGEVAVAVLALAGNEEQRDKTKLKEILVNFYSALHPLTVASRREHLNARTASASTSSDQPASERQ
jgi:hypothetical protein